MAKRKSGRQRKNGLYVYTHPASGIRYIRGIYHGVRVDRSADTRSEREANDVKAKIEREIYDEVVLGKPRDRKFAEAASGYMKSGGDRTHMAKILTAQVMIDNRAEVFGELLLKQIDQTAIDDLAVALVPAREVVKNGKIVLDERQSTRNRHVYTPVSAVMQWAGRQRSWGFVAGQIQRPKQPKGRLDWRTPKEIEWWIKRGGPIAPLIAFYVGAGARASEPINLDWPDVSIGGNKVQFWEEDTKSGNVRGVDLQMRVRAVLPPRPENGKGKVFLTGAGAPWATSIGVSKALDRITIAEAREKATALELDELDACRRLARMAAEQSDREARLAAAARAREILEAITERENIPWIHPHVFRHTWATWAYAVTRDMPWVMKQGGWESTELALRYIHVASDDLRDDVLAHGWEIRASSAAARPLALPAL